MQRGSANIHTPPVVKRKCQELVHVSALSESLGSNDSHALEQIEKEEIDADEKLCEANICSTSPFSASREST